MNRDGSQASLLARFASLFGLCQISGLFKWAAVCSLSLKSSKHLLFASTQKRPKGGGILISFYDAPLTPKPIPHHIPVYHGGVGQFGDKNLLVGGPITDGSSLTCTSHFAGTILRRLSGGCQVEKWGIGSCFWIHGPAFDMSSLVP